MTVDISNIRNDEAEPVQRDHWDQQGLRWTRTRLTSPVTTYFPSGEKARVVMAFLKHREHTELPDRNTDEWTRTKGLS